MAVSDPARPSAVRRAVTLWLLLYCQGLDGSAPRLGDGWTRVAGGWGWTREPTSAGRGPASDPRSRGEQTEASQPADRLGVVRWRMPILYANVRRNVASRVGNDSVSSSLGQSQLWLARAQMSRARELKGWAVRGEGPRLSLFVGQRGPSE